MRKAKERELLSRLLKKVYCVNCPMATLLHAIGIIASVVLAIVFLKNLDWWLDESVLETLAVLYIFCGMGLLPYWLGGKVNHVVEEKKRKTILNNKQLPGERKMPYRGCFRFAGKIYESKKQLCYFALDHRRTEFLDCYGRNVWIIRNGKRRKKKQYKEWIFLQSDEGWHSLCYKATGKSMTPIENLPEIECSFFGKGVGDLTKADFQYYTEGEPNFWVKVRRIVTTRKRIWIPAFILCLLLCTDLSYRFGTCGADARWRLGYDGVMTISGTGSVSENPYQQHERDILDLSPIYYESLVKKVVIEEGISEIGSDAFSHYRSMETIELPNSLCCIGEYAFEYCDQLKTVSFPDNVTWIGECAFEDCSRLESVSLSNNLTVISEGTFYGCENLREIVIPDGVEEIDAFAFGDCRNLQEVRLPEGLVSIRNRAFINCNSLTHLSIPNSVKVIDGSFQNCEKLVDISLGNGLTTLDVAAFRKCISLKEITIPDSCTVIGNNVFEGCENLATVDLGAGVTLIGEEGFAGCGLQELMIPDSVTTIGESAFAWCDDLYKITLGNGINRIPKGAFACCTSLKNVTLPDNIVFVDEGAFAECENLSQVNLSSETMYIPQSEEYTSFPETVRINSGKN